MLSSIRSTASRLVLRRQMQRSAARAYTSYSQLPEEHKMIYEMCRKFADEELAPNAGKWDKDHAFPTEAVSQLVCPLFFFFFFLGGWRCCSVFLVLCYCCCCCG